MKDIKLLSWWKDAKYKADKIFISWVFIALFLALIFSASLVPALGSVLAP